MRICWTPRRLARADACPSFHFTPACLYGRLTLSECVRSISHCLLYHYSCALSLLLLGRDDGLVVLRLPTPTRLPACLFICNTLALQHVNVQVQYSRVEYIVMYARAPLMDSMIDARMLCQTPRCMRHSRPEAPARSLRAPISTATYLTPDPHRLRT